MNDPIFPNGLVVSLSSLPLFYMGKVSNSAFILSLALILGLMPWIIYYILPIYYTKGEELKQTYISSSVSILVSVLIAVFYTRTLK